MRSFGRQSGLKKWARVAMKFGLLLTDAKMWASVNEQLREGAEDIGDEAKRRYEDTVERLHDARYALQGRNQWVAPTINFIGGVGIGVGLGLLFAPVSGEEARAALRNKVVQIRNGVRDMAGEAAGARPRTGTEGY